MAHLLRVAEVRDGLESQGADDGHQGEQARGEEDHPGMSGEQQDVPVIRKIFRIIKRGEIIFDNLQQSFASNSHLYANKSFKNCHNSKNSQE